MKINVLANLSGVQRIRHSQLSNYENCPWCYWLTYVKDDGKWAEENKVGNGLAQAGSAVHKVIEEYYKNKISKYELPKLFEQEWQTGFLDAGYRVEIRLPNFKMDKTNDYYEQFMQYFNDFRAYDYLDVDGEHIGCKILEVETTYDMLVSNGEQKIRLAGTVDGIGITGKGEYVVWDSKSRSKWKNKADLAKYARQLYLYSLFVKEEYGEYPTYLCFNQFRLEDPKRVTVVKFDMAEFQDTIDWAFSTVETIDKDRLYLPSCDQFFADNLCEFRDCCEYSLKR